MNQCDLKVGCLASKMLDLSNPDLIENAGDVLSWHGAATKRGRGQPAKDFTNLEEIFSPCAGASLYRKSFLDELEGFDEHFFAYLEDVDLGLRGRLQGYKYLFVPSAEVLHQSHGSQISHNRYVRLITKNRLLLFLKNIPSILLLRHLHTLLYGQFYFLVAYRKPFSSLIGYLSCIALIPYIFRERKRLKKIKISRESLNQLLEEKMHEPPLYRMFMKKVKNA
jgi:GT2 family glycosyltransferase